MTGNQKVTKYVLGELPSENVWCTESCGGLSAGQGKIYVDGKWFASVPRIFYDGKLPTEKFVDSVEA